MQEEFQAVLKRHSCEILERPGLEKQSQALQGTWQLPVSTAWHLKATCMHLSAQGSKDVSVCYDLSDGCHEVTHVTDLTGEVY